MNGGVCPRLVIRTVAVDDRALAFGDGQNPFSCYSISVSYPSGLGRRRRIIAGLLTFNARLDELGSPPFLTAQKPLRFSSFQNECRK